MHCIISDAFQILRRALYQKTLYQALLLLSTTCIHIMLNTHIGGIGPVALSKMTVHLTRGYKE